MNYMNYSYQFISHTSYFDNDRNAKRNLSTAFRASRDRYISSVCCDDTAADEEAETGAGQLQLTSVTPALELVEYSLPVFGWNANTFVQHLHLYAGANLFGANDYLAGR